MFKSRITKTLIAFSSYAAAILSAPQQAFAQLSIGRYGIQPGLESNYLQYQMSGRSLSQMRVIPGCGVGDGAGCNKTATVLQQLVESNGGPSYQELLIRAAGGQQNYQNFASFYGNNPNLSQVPHASFWQNDNPYMMDGYRYLLGQTVSRTPQPGLGQVAKNFYWAPEGTGNSLDPRSGLLNLKYSYGRLLLEEAAKIPNLKQQIQSQDLPADVKQFYASNASEGLRALNSGNERQLEGKLLEVLSEPFSPDGAEYNRPNAGIPREFDDIIGQGLPGDVFVGAVPVLPEGEVLSQEIVPPPVGEVVAQGGGGGFPFWVLGGIPLLALPFLFGGGGGDDSPDRVAVVPPPTVGEQPPAAGETPPGGGVTPPPVGEQPPGGGVTPPPVGEQPPGGGVTPPPVGEQPPGGGVTPPPVGEQPPGGGVQPIPEPSTLTPLFLWTMIMSMLGYRKWRMQTKG
ncbi:hypothetical protein SD81_002365 [Tolypothrix campylonemoides VB511288]|nr:hypothetical protein SD81_002365 [Tolypothrix campylonemoides VB511288]